MRTTFLIGIVSLVAMAPAFAEKPALIVQITVDQLRGDMPLKLQERFGEGGFRRFLDEGIAYTNAHFRHLSTYTASGHATLVTGTNPSGHGVIGNSWYDRASGKTIYALHDDDHVLTTGKRSAGTSPKNLLSSTIGDELVMATNGAAKVFAVAIKDRGAITQAGRKGKAFWFDSGEGTFLSSTFYYDELPQWAQQWNNDGHASVFAGKQWELLHDRDSYAAKNRAHNAFEKGDRVGAGNEFPHEFPDEASGRLYNALRLSPYGDWLTMEFAKTVVEAEALGEDEVPDILFLGLSVTDYIGHIFGPDSLEAEDNLLRLDAHLSEFFEFIDETVGEDRVLYVLSSDHGVCAVPEYLETQNFNGGRIDLGSVQETLAAAFAEFPDGENYLEGFSPPWIYLDEGVIEDAGVDVEDVEAAVVRAMVTVPGLAHAFTRGQLLRGDVPATMFGERVLNAFHPPRTGNVVVVQEQFWTGGSSSNAADHGSPYAYDTYVPMYFAGDFSGRRIHTPSGPENIAPTLAAILEVPPPSAASYGPLPAVLAALR